MFFLSHSFSLRRPAAGAAALPSFGSWRLFGRGLAAMVPRVMLVVVGAALVAWALAMLALVG